ncbi:2-oxoglutarate dehydrogenase E1 component [Bacillus shivajii]|uniref:2-oxoglutarate dehydrogenase E1 component n=1 Tax=Bacillus shivajii TaxID=1983719 RepID=UPI001CF957B9|nr:2-oxoglutarate dehydrogenase E1 component [Bacillus shivajii]UCZ54909.1 2-oxoglutarate dehydrogenase E1 component [Bacillus shivajii]
MANNGVRLDEGWSQFYGPNFGYMLEVYEDFLNDPNSVDEDLQQFFNKWGAPEEKDLPQQTTVQDKGQFVPSAEQVHSIANAIKLSESIRRNGHLLANISPIEPRQEKELFHLESFQLTEDLLKAVPAELLCPQAPSHVKNGLDAINHLKEVYTSTLAFEFNQVHDIEERKWLYEMVESGKYRPSFSTDKKKQLLERLNKVEGFEGFIHKTFKGQKRFSIEGLDSMVPMLDEIVRESVEDGTRNIMIGMAHRGRLNVLAHVLGKPYEIIFSEFHDAPNKDLVPSEGSTGINYGWTGDVKYHLGADREIKESTVEATVTLANNPSHLEFVNPVVEGFARAAQDDRSSPGYPTQEKKKAMPILIHGDAAFPGQGVVAETLNLGKIKGYSTGGTVHLIANNMIGFTTVSGDSRSTEYASDLAKGFEIPIIHVNADDPEACISAMHLAYLYRRNFNKDILIDLIGYRRFGHNEMDEPLATQPSRYKKIRDHKTAFELYGQKLVKEGIVQENDLPTMKETFNEKLANQFERIKGNKRETIDEVMEPPTYVADTLENVDTKVDIDLLKKLNEELLDFPKNFNVFPKLEKILKRRNQSLDKDGKVDWALAETLALASTISEGTPIRLTGQDTERGTFAHRHIVLHDYENDKTYSPIHEMKSAKASFAIYNSPLSEMACVGFEYGYNVHAPETLTIWEAQFGDFSNGAQVMFDQFISAGNAKWGQKSGLVLLLPHGYEGQGPEHSSGRVERFLQLAAENNWHVANLTKASQYFHILRRQAKLLEKDEVRPLVIMTPKSLLRNENVASLPEELSEGKFHPVVEQSGLGNKKKKVERLIFCSGKIAVDLEQSLQDIEDTDWLHIARVEELYPFPKKHVVSLLEKYSNVKEIVWVQEEPQNMGAWHYILPHFEQLASDAEVKYIGRRRRSSTAEGDPQAHKKEQQRIVTEALTRNLKGETNE